MDRDSLPTDDPTLDVANCTNCHNPFPAGLADSAGRCEDCEEHAEARALLGSGPVHVEIETTADGMSIYLAPDFHYGLGTSDHLGALHGIVAHMYRRLGADVLDDVEIDVDRKALSISYRRPAGASQADVLDWLDIELNRDGYVACDVDA